MNDRTGDIHSRILDQLSAYLDDELSAEEKAEVESHLSGCSACSASLEAIRAARISLGSLERTEMPLEASDRLMAAVRSQLQQKEEPVTQTPSETASTRGVWPWQWHLPAWGAVAAVLAVAIMVGLTLSTFNFSAMQATSPESEMAPSLQDQGPAEGGAPPADHDSRAGGSAKGSLTEDSAGGGSRGPSFTNRQLSESDVESFSRTEQGNIAMSPITDEEIAALRKALLSAARSDRELAAALQLPEVNQGKITYAEQVVFEGQISWLIVTREEGSVSGSGGYQLNVVANGRVIIRAPLRP